MNETREVPLKELNLEDNREVISPPTVKGPLYKCATAITVIGFIAHADLDLEINGTIVSTEPGGFPLPDGHTFRPVGPLNIGDVVRARQWRLGIPSNWSQTITVRSHLEDYPAGLPRPQINPAPVYECGSRTGVSNLAIGCNTWIEADSSEVGRVNGAKDHQGININPDYSLNQNVRAFAELCSDPAPASQLYVTQVAPSPLPVPAIDSTYEESEQIRITNLVNGARFSIERNGINLGIWRTWGGTHLVSLNPKLTTGETLAVRQTMCPGTESDPGETKVLPCSELPAPEVAPIQDGDTEVRLTKFAPGATITVFASLMKIGEGGGDVIQLIRPIAYGEVIHVVQSVGNCVGQTARELRAQCVAPPVSFNPANLDLFPVGFLNYVVGDLKGVAYYPAEDDGEESPFRERLAKLGPVPIVFIAHGNHGTFYNPSDRTQESCGNPGGWIEIPNYKGYVYLQEQLARLGVISVSIDCNATNCKPYAFSNIEDRAELILRTVDLFKSFNAGDSALFKNKIDFSKAGLMGHSRGGEAVILAANQAPNTVSVNFKAVISLAPTDSRLYSIGASLIPDDYAFMTLLPAGDGDVRDNDGAKFYDPQKPAPFKSQLYVYNTGHNFFNREWPLNDGTPSSVILSRTTHERILSAYGCALFRAFLLQQNTLGFLTYRQLPANVLTSYVHLSFEFAEQLTIDDHEQNNTIGVNSLGGTTQQIGGLIADEYTFSQAPSSTPSQYNSSFYGNTVGMVTEYKEDMGVFRSEFPPGELSQENAEIWIRAAEVYTGGNLSGNTTGFELGLEDSNGIMVWVDSDEVGSIPRPYDRPDSIKTMLKTLRFPLDCFSVKNARFNSRNIKAILIRCNRRERRPLAFDVLQVVNAR